MAQNASRALSPAGGAFKRGQAEHGEQSTTNRKLIVFELNEVPFQVMDAYVRRHPHSNFAHIMKSGAQFVARTPDSIYLHPRISWPTFHRGVPDDVHGILEYNKDTTDLDKTHPVVWELVRNAGKRIGIGGSIGSYPVPTDLSDVSFYLPDMFAPSPETYPSKLSAFQSLNISAAAKSSRVVRKETDAGKAVDLLRNAHRLGITPRTLFAIARQLTTERINSHRIVRRRTLQALLSFDIVFKQIQKIKPDFATFFTNHVASSMHRYWAAAFPDDYAGTEGADTKRSSLENPVTENEMPDEWIETYKDEIDFCMNQCDGMIGRLLSFVDDNPEYRILIITTMGQRAARGKPRTNEVTLVDMAQLLDRLGFGADEWTELPGMHPTYCVRFADGDRYDQFVDAAGRLEVAGGGLKVDSNGPRTAAFAVRAVDVDPADALVTIDGESASIEEFGLALTKIQDGVGKSGGHTPEGAALIYDPTTELAAEFGKREIVDSTAFTAAILSSFDVPVPEYMPPPPDTLAECLV